MSDRFDSGRIEAFSDGVLAIAITLLVLEIAVPESGYADLLQAILDEWPSYLGYVTSFLTIGVVWLAHHGIFMRMAYADHVIVRLNLVLLMVASFLPFPTALLANSVEDEDAERTAVLFYGAVLFVMVSLLAALCRYAASRPELLRAPEDANALLRSAARLAPGLGVYLGVIALAVLAPRVAAFGYLAVAVFGVLVARGHDAPEPAA